MGTPRAKTAGGQPEKSETTMSTRAKRRASAAEGRNLPGRVALLIRTLRSLEGKSQQELAESSGVSQGYLSLIEADTRKFEVLTTLESLAWSLGIKLSELIAFAEKPGLPEDLTKHRSKLLDDVLKSGA